LPLTAEEIPMTDLYAEALARFDELYARAMDCGLPEANAMNVATVGADGRPASRILLLKGHDRRGFVFYTNFRSRKGEELLANPSTALCFFWNPLQEQVRIEGLAEPVSDAEADAYFATRPRMSQVGAWASDQSQPLDSRATFEQRLDEVEARFRDQDVPRPPHWSGFRVRPERIEFWRGIENRLHERTLYWLDEGEWKRGLLFP
jgi:pyridoxamine 5'-phosphate oxidase